MGPEIRRVSVELLRHGPRHNQLLSPLTPYLAVCGDFPGGVVHAPYEQAEVQNLLDDLRYVVASAEPSDRLSVIRDRAGADIAEMLANVPGLPGVLAGETADSGELTHLRIVMSAAELGLLPFELSKIPVGAGSVGDGWLALQPDRPLCLTRNVRGVSGSMVPWPIRPRILYVSGSDVPFEQHLDALERVLEPWRVEGLRRVDGSDRHWTSPDLTVLREATMEEIRTLVAEGNFTHVHVLAHGAEIEQRRAVRYGIALGDRVITGADLALVLSTVAGGARSLPSVVTLASCDSGAQGEVITPGGSVAHDLHASGIPLVVASQFPISEEAS
ncbi:MAG TPA: CHAT domain-containing protein, partial [Ilumatobacteraceae bacterium]